MQTITLQVRDDFRTEFMKMIDTVKDNVVVQKNGVPLGCKNLEHDPYFYDRQKKLQQIRDDIESGNAEMLTQKQYDEEMEQFFKNLEKQHAN